MKRFWFCLSLLCACQQSVVSPSAAVQGLRDMVKVGGSGTDSIGYIVMTSTETNELRVLQLDTGDATIFRKYLRAPNPIQALAIPVLKRPTTLATDVVYPSVADDNAIALDRLGPYVYAASPATAEISIVWAENTDATLGFSELKRLATIAPVTAMAAEGGDAAMRDGAGPLLPTPGTLYFATSDGTTSTLFRVNPRGPTELVAQDLQAEVQAVFTRTGETIIDMIVLPNHRLALATRAANGKTGTAGIYDGTTGALLVPLKFPSPVRSLYTHGEYKEPGQTKHPAGARVYGVLDEDTCGSSACGGIVSVESDTGERTLSAAGRALPATVPIEQRVAPPLTFGGGLVQSVGLTPSGLVAIPPTLGVAVPLPVLGVVTLSNGLIGAFRADQMEHLFAADAGASAVITLPDAGTFTTFDDAGAGPVVALANGAARDEDIFAVGNGYLPGLLSLVPDGGLYATDFAARAQVGDLIEGEGCTAATVTQVEAGGVRVGPACAAASINVRAAGAQPYVVTGTTQGYLGRSGSGQTLTFAGTYTAHYPGYDPSRPALSIAFPSSYTLHPDERYVIAVDDGFLETAFTLTTVGCSVGATTLPGAIFADSIRQKIFVGYPSANAIIELDPSLVRRTTSYDTGLLCWR
ncbi:MAG: hypothetical protein IPJ65_18140 [Archangiaceae bacterium]|nr:hypothetical protein [Archangiaceae bacterium]